MATNTTKALFVKLGEISRVLSLRRRFLANRNSKRNIMAFRQALQRSTIITERC